MSNFKFKIEGMKELERSLKELGEVPQRHVTSSARKAMNIPLLRAARVNAPYHEGYLEKGMKLKGERSRHRGKKVYQVVFDEGYNHVFQTRNKEGKIVGYYPVAQEYGFFARDGSYIPGYRFIRGALTENAPKIERTIVSEMKKKIDAEIMKGDLK